MKLLSMKCPNCNAKLEYNDDLDKINCNYCGNTIIVDKEEQIVKIKTSKLDNSIDEMIEYYENGNYIKCESIAKELIIEYPSNKKIKEYMKKSAIKIIEPVLEKYKNHEYVDRSILGNDLSLVNHYNDVFPDDVEFKEYLNLIKGYKKINLGIADTIVLVISILISLFVIIILIFGL